MSWMRSKTEYSQFLRSFLPLMRLLVCSVGLFGWADILMTTLEISVHMAAADNGFSSDSIFVAFSHMVSLVSRELSYFLLVLCRSWLYPGKFIFIFIFIKMNRIKYISRLEEQLPKCNN